MGAKAHEDEHEMVLFTDEKRGTLDWSDRWERNWVGKSQ